MYINGNVRWYRIDHNSNIHNEVAYKSVHVDVEIPSKVDA
jgi:hypothetical protein